MPAVTDELIAFFVQFEVSTAAANLQAAPALLAEPASLTFSEHDVRRTLKATNCAESLHRSASHSIHHHLQCLHGPVCGFHLPYLYPRTPAQPA